LQNPRHLLSVLTKTTIRSWNEMKWKKTTFETYQEAAEWRFHALASRIGEHYIDIQFHQSLHVPLPSTSSVERLPWRDDSSLSESLVIRPPPFSFWISKEPDRLCGPGFDSRHYQKKISKGSGTGSTQPREYN
jgi:hypothetical protein